MKRLTLIFITLATCFLLSSSQCKKNKSDADYVYGLPPATQEGKNTLGFVLNGEPWTPKGSNGTANLSIDFDEGYNNGVLGIVAYRTKSASDKTQFILGIHDSLKLKTAPFTLSIYKKSIGALSYSTKDGCSLNHYDTTIYETGKISITKLDRASRIVAGTFEAVLYKNICGDSIRITSGRFDMKY